MRILICGGRDFTNFDRCEKDVLELVGEEKDITFITGTANGADSLVYDLWAKYDCKIEEYPADWKDLEAQPCLIKENKYGKYNALAGFARNQRMLDQGEPDIALVYWDGVSSGTKDMIDRCKKAQIKVIVNRY